MADEDFPYSLEKLFSMAPEPIPEARWYEAVGRLVTAYASAEGAIFELARRLSRLSEDKGRIVFGGMRRNDVVERCRKLLELQKSARQIADANDCFSQLGVVGERRDWLVHRFVSPQGNSLLVSNYQTAKSLALIENALFNLTDLRNMKNDCVAIAVRITSLHNPSFRKDNDQETKRFVRAPWRYKPPQQAKGKKRKSRADPK